ncbi:sigma-54-dependent Fis family transcriptional regulator [Moorella sp. Hama-1]|uniref:sigma-54-dependent Fis family transcriptional regulator n=1 Tax=Moorella sp. Hama-1 TaxID=2138101 RepID=UPI000D65623C|nr:sigma-54-dependent Fis family transcriptional regulator [Moorella sp. Hama-1]BCV21953.1 sigma-54-dependent Fis family transcriptional regulator [Moorella sp. Hama-1]
MRESHEKETYFYWEKMVIKGENPETIAGYINSMIFRSWQRCLEKKLNPEKPIAMRLPEPEIKARRKHYQRLIEVAAPFLENLYRLVKGSGFVVVLLDKEACILELMGDQEILNRDYHFQIGEFWDEETKGTNAMGLVKIEQKHLQVYATEHYCRANHWLTCSAAPIHGENGEMLGILDVSGDYRRAHAHTLGMVVAAVQAIENQLRLEAAGAEITRSYNNITAIIDSMSEGLISFDKYGQITKMNHVAVKMLGIAAEDCVGQPINKILGLPGIIDNLLTGQRAINDQEVFLDTNHGRLQFLLTGRPIMDQERKIYGGVITLRAMKSVQRLVTRMVGARAQFTFDDILGHSPALRRTIQTAKAVALSMSSVLLEGESGTGKEMFAQAIHNASPVAKGPFVAINCGAIPRDLLESELFGYEEGAFTGAKRGGRPGKFELANEGTIFLDEVSDMPLETQVSLLRVLQEKQVVRVGGLTPIPVNIRVIAATNRNLKKEVEKGNFRNDLYYRLNVICLAIPPLRDREGDVILLANYFIQKFSSMLKLAPCNLDPATARALESYWWPGNVRELSNAIERAVNLARGKTITLEHLPEPLQLLASNGKIRETNLVSLEKYEEKLILETLKETGGNISQCAAILGIGRNTLYRKLKKYSIPIPRR